MEGPNIGGLCSRREEDRGLCQDRSRPLGLGELCVPADGTLLLDRQRMSESCSSLSAGLLSFPRRFFIQIWLLLDSRDHLIADSGFSWLYGLELLAGNEGDET